MGRRGGWSENLRSVVEGADFRLATEYATLRAESRVL